MSSEVSSEVETLFSEIHKSFGIAEQKIKLIANLPGDLGGLTFPPVNQLRYVAFHLLRADKKETDKEKIDELIKTKNHCHRAIYDAAECGIQYFLKEFDSFNRDYKDVVVTDVIPQYIAYLDKAEEARKFIADGNTVKKSIEDAYSSHDLTTTDQLDKSQKLFDALYEINKLLPVSRQELNKKVEKERKKLIQASKKAIREKKKWWIAIVMLFFTSLVFSLNAVSFVLKLLKLL